MWPRPIFRPWHPVARAERQVWLGNVPESIRWKELQDHVDQAGTRWFLDPILAAGATAMGVWTRWFLERIFGSLDRFFWGEILGAWLQRKSDLQSNSQQAAKQLNVFVNRVSMKFMELINHAMERECRAPKDMLTPARINWLNPSMLSFLAGKSWGPEKK